MSKRTEKRKLPTGVTEFEELIQALREEYGDQMPTSDDDSIRFAIASNIMHMGPQDSHKSLNFWHKTLVAGAAKQVAHHVFRETKLKHEQRQRDEAAAAEAKEVQSETQG